LATGFNWGSPDFVRYVVDVSGDRRGDVVGFGPDGVWVAQSLGNGGFTSASRALASLGSNDGWTPKTFPRLMADLTGDGRADIIAFGNNGVWTALAQPDGTFAAAALKIADFGADHGWTVQDHVRLAADLTGDGRADFVAFGNAGVSTALSDGAGGFAAARLVLQAFGNNQGWRTDVHPRFVVDLTGDGRADLVGFSDAGVWTALSDGAGGFAAPRSVLGNFCINAGGWQVSLHPRLVVDLTGDGRADIIGFGNDGVWTSLGDGAGGFAAPRFVLQAFGLNQGWGMDRHLRLLADVTGDGKPDIVGFGDAGVHLALNNGDGTFAPAQLVVGDLGYNQGWRVDQHPRFAVDVTGDGRADIVGFGPDGVWTVLSTGSSFASARFLQADFMGNALSPPPPLPPPPPPPPPPVFS